MTEHAPSPDAAIGRTRPLRVAAFGFRSLPPRAGSAGADKFALELLPRLVELGCEVTAYSRVYPDDPDFRREATFHGVRVVSHRTIARKGFDTLLHSLKATLHILRHGTADVVHIQNGGNSPFAVLLRLLGKRTFVSQDGPDWVRDKWPWYAKVYLWLMQHITAYGPTSIIFDNVFIRARFEKKFRRQYFFVPFGADVTYDPASRSVLDRLGLEEGRYFLFVGRFIPDKGLHYLRPAFERLQAPDVKLVLIGGSPNPSDYETRIRDTDDPRVVMPGFMYGPEIHALMKHALAYVQPSDVEGLSPVILESAFLGAPIVCSDIEQNAFIMGDNALYFRAGSTDDLQRKLESVIADPAGCRAMAAAGQADIRARFNWMRVAQDHLDIFTGVLQPRDGRAAATGPVVPGSAETGSQPQAGASRDRVAALMPTTETMSAVGRTGIGS